MQKNKRLRVFAGPNGSGKSTLFKEFQKVYNPGYFINADKLEKKLNDTGFIDLGEISLSATEKDLIRFSGLKEAKSLLAKSAEKGHPIDIEIKENCIVGNSENTHSYEASYVAAFIRWLLYKAGKSFSFETVMSHISKVRELKKAKKKGYKTYLYFICTDDSEINVDRVKDRIAKGGHPVDENSIRSRYPGTLKHLYPAIKYSDRVYLFDNSGKQLVLIAEIFEGTLQLKVNNPPGWFLKYVLPHYQAI